VDARFDLQGGQPIVVPGADGAACCAANVADVVLGALRARPADPVVLPMTPTPPRLTAEALAALGVKEVVGQFTTFHPAGQPRVANIHRMADLVRGQLIPPNATLSINKLIGQRTAEKGFVPAPAIGDSNILSPEVGGGISQFMTTLFNAAFFAGLDYGDYQSHSLYISRYPYGREATINWPAPDLQVKNTTPYGVLVWPTYDDKSITVTLYSTKYLAKVEQTDQIKTPYLKSCTDVKTERTRTYLDGRVVKDYIRARYNLKEGLVCGDPPDATPRTTTTAKSTPTTKKG
jgi:vancomycin resistance protein YoaR